MFSLDGSRTPCSLSAECLIANSGLPFEPLQRGSLTAVLYRRDPRNDYLYLTAMVGLSQPEPMFGLHSYDDARLHKGMAQYSANPLGFAQRENIEEGAGWHEVFPEEPASWQLHVSGRTRDSRRSYLGRIRSEMVSALSRLMAHFESSDPLFPELWFEEIILRDQLRRAVSELPVGSGIQAVASILASRLCQWIAHRWLVGSGVDIGIYFWTGDDWHLCNYELALPRLIPRGSVDDEAMNVFAWVARSTRPVLLQKEPSGIWLRRLLASHADFEQIASDPRFRGMCIVPIPDISSSRYSPGILVLTARDKRSIAPAHLYLLSRIAISLARYLVPLLPIPGFPWWPDAKLARGHATVTWPEGTSEPDRHGKTAEQFAAQLMPTGSRVFMRPLRLGRSGASVYRLDLLDERGLREIPRVLKVGGSKDIAEELKRYYRYVHNKQVGWHSWVDVARSGEAEWDTETRAAIAYTFVGPAETAVDWFNWALEPSRGEISSALDNLFAQLSCWYRRTRQDPVTQSTLGLLIGPLVQRGLRSAHGDRFKNPTKAEVLGRLASLLKSRVAVRATTCVVHGDLHSANVFSLFDSQHNVSGVALIDWGLVRSGRHPLSDISKLMTDLHYKVRWDVKQDMSAERKWAWEEVEKWGRLLGCESADWKVALIHQMAKMLFYEASGEAQGYESYLSGEARRAAWEDLQELSRKLE